MANYSFTFKDDSLEHHGIEGQKWGVRNGPPYPLGSDQHSKAEIKAMQKDQKSTYKIVSKAINKKKNYETYSHAASRSNKLNNLITERLKDNDTIKRLSSIRKQKYDVLKKYEEQHENELLEYVESLLDSDKPLNSSIHSKYINLIDDYNDSVTRTKNYYKQLAEEALGKYANEPVYSKNKVGGKIYTFSNYGERGKYKSYVSTASDILAQAIENYVSDGKSPANSYEKYYY